MLVCFFLVNTGSLFAGTLSKGEFDDWYRKDVKGGIVTFEQQFPNTYTAKVIANYFGKEITGVIDEDIQNCKGLSIDGSNLTDLTGIEIFSKLENIGFGNNKIKTLPGSIGKLTNLQYMHAFNNEITSLPDSIGDLINLKILDIKHNKLTNLPDSFKYFKNIQMEFVDFSNNLFPTNFAEQLQSYGFTNYGNMMQDSLVLKQ
ncbi:hypothetical protein AZF37_08010 [endosymbiont 'TC1' of Trimyema compressum]|uniref:leucine-rich repeat domain-containing protein n=1 Tax=endosymbiont 'TC1' of Trimyema compressum TaxID=243899 RepID=UPI0007F17192|nr:leucine-rich repeat domain-containing protein [endosymbiont 'TC1' of Trimyema compressum]AMP21108.1 hypothetical protein AZF37_08010 [endosymbiont 'TC1' of Trimyema compressum]